jgi:hypothetical protein
MGRDGLAVGLPENRSCGHLLPMSGRCDESLTVKPPAAQAGPRGSERFTRYCGAGRARSPAVGLETTRGFGATINSARIGPVRAGRWQPGTELLRAWQAERPGHCVRRDSGSRPPERIRNGGISPHARATTPAVQNGNGASGRHRLRRGLPRSGVTVCACPRRTCVPLLHAPFRLKLESGHSTDPAHERGMGATQQPPWRGARLQRAEMSWAGPPSDCTVAPTGCGQPSGSGTVSRRDRPGRGIGLLTQPLEPGRRRLRGSSCWLWTRLAGLTLQRLRLREKIPRHRAAPNDGRRMPGR